MSNLRMKQKTKYTLILIIFILSLVSASILSFVPVEQACGPDSGKGCGKVQNSIYAKTLGIKNSHYGVATFLFLSIYGILQLKKPSKDKEEMIKLGIIISAIIATYFIILQLFIIKEICKYCMVVDIGALINLGLIFFSKKK